MADDAGIPQIETLPLNKVSQIQPQPALQEAIEEQPDVQDRKALAEAQVKEAQAQKEAYNAKKEAARAEIEQLDLEKRSIELRQKQAEFEREQERRRQPVISVLGKEFKENYEPIQTTTVGKLEAQKMAKQREDQAKIQAEIDKQKLINAQLGTRAAEAQIKILEAQKMPKLQISQEAAQKASKSIEALTTPQGASNIAKAINNPQSLQGNTAQQPQQPIQQQATQTEVPAVSYEQAQLLLAGGLGPYIEERQAEVNGNRLLNEIGGSPYGNANQDANLLRDLGGSTVTEAQPIQQVRTVQVPSKPIVIVQQAKPSKPVVSVVKEKPTKQVVYKVPSEKKEVRHGHVGRPAKRGRPSKKLIRERMRYKEKKEKG